MLTRIEGGAAFEVRHGDHLFGGADDRAGRADRIEFRSQVTVSLVISTSATNFVIASSLSLRRPGEAKRGSSAHSGWPKALEKFAG